MSSRNRNSNGNVPGWPLSDHDPLALRALSLVASRVAVGRVSTSAEWVSRLAEASLEDNPARFTATEQDLRAARVSVDLIVDTLIPEAARAVGQSWVSDRAGFAGVSIASARLQSLLRDLTRRDLAMAWTVARGVPRSVLVVVPDGEQHTMGALVAASQLARLGFDAVLSLCESPSRLRARLRAERFAAVCLSLSRREALENAHVLVELIRESCGYPIKVMIGGAAVLDAEPDGIQTGADATTNDLQEALRVCGLTISLHGDVRSAIRA